jgi:hypothetical protein
METPDYKDYRHSDEAYQDQLNYLVSRLRAALRELHGRDDQSEAFNMYREKWKPAYIAELVCNLFR